MRRRRFLTGLLATLLPGAALAQDVVGTVVSQLRSQGYDRISVSRTLLGRARVQARSASQQREIVINPVTGEILRDVWTTRGNAGRNAGQIVNPRGVNDDVDDDDDDADEDGRGRGRGRGRGGDDDREDSDDSDNSGSGSGSSGSGSGGSGSGRGGDDDGDDGDDGDNSGSGSSGSGGGDDD